LQNCCAPHGKKGGKNDSLDIQLGRIFSSLLTLYQGFLVWPLIILEPDAYMSLLFAQWSGSKKLFFIGPIKKKSLLELHGSEF
jgi:hypothetical protein